MIPCMLLQQRFTAGQAATAQKIVRRARHAKWSHRAGAAVIEFAVVAPLMITLTLGMMELGRMVMVKQLLVNASREGARQAILPGSTAEGVVGQTTRELEASSIYGATISVNPASLSSAVAGTSVTVTISVSAESVSWIPKPMFGSQKTIEAATTMRKESL